MATGNGAQHMTAGERKASASQAQYAWQGGVCAETGARSLGVPAVGVRAAPPSHQLPAGLLNASASFSRDRRVVWTGESGWRICVAHFRCCGREQRRAATSRVSRNADTENLGWRITALNVSAQSRSNSPPWDVSALSRSNSPSPVMGTLTGCGCGCGAGTRASVAACWCGRGQSAICCASLRNAVRSPGARTRG